MRFEKPNSNLGKNRELPTFPLTADFRFVKSLTTKLLKPGLQMVVRTASMFLTLLKVILKYVNTLSATLQASQSYMTYISYVDQNRLARCRTKKATIGLCDSMGFSKSPGRS